MNNRELDEYLSSARPILECRGATVVRPGALVESKIGHRTLYWQNAVAIV